MVPEANGRAHAPGARSAAPVPAARKASTPVVSLQRSVGNRAVAALVAGQSSTRQLSRTPSDIATGPRPQIDPAPVRIPLAPSRIPLDVEFLTEEDRKQLAQWTVARLSDAYTNWGRAVDAHVKSLNAADKVRGDDLFWALFQTVFGLVAPLITRGAQKLAGKLAPLLDGTKKARKRDFAAAADAVPKAEEAAKKANWSLKLNQRDAKIAEAAAQRNKPGAAANYKKTQGQLVKAETDARRAASELEKAKANLKTAEEALSAADVDRLLNHGDYIKESWKGAARIIKATDTGNPPKQSQPLFGETDVDAFGVKLVSYFQQKKDHMVGLLTNDAAGKQPRSFNDLELVALWSGFAPEVANETTYRDEVGKIFADFKKYVRPIGIENVALDEEARIFRHTKYFGVKVRTAGGGHKVAIVRYSTTTTKRGSDSKQAWNYVSDEIGPLVLEKTEREFGTVDTVDERDLIYTSEKRMSVLDRVRERRSDQELADEQNKRADKLLEEVGKLTEPGPAGSSGRLPLAASVGEDADNRPDDVRRVGTRLHALGFLPRASTDIEEITEAIWEYQLMVLKLKKADGRVEPGGATQKALVAGRKAVTSMSLK